MAPASHDDRLKGEPQGYFVVVPSDDGGERVDVASLVRRLWRGKIWLAAGVALFGGLAFTHATLSDRVYESQVLVTVRSQDMEGAASAIRSQLGGLASLAGIGLGQASRRREEFIAYLRSSALAREFVERYELLRVLYPSRWNPQTKSVRPDGNGHVPTVGEVAIQLMRGVREVNVDERTGLVTVAVRWGDPKTAADWANNYVALANERLREEAIQSATQSIGFLNEELSKTNVEPIRQSLFRLLEGRLNDSMLANVERQYAFKVIDRAEPSEPDRYVKPRRVLETLIGILCGISFGTLFVLWRFPDRRPAASR
jgi:uncharacterized protein involved in exopolysaccharide biosynthesis